ncbi:MAG: hypothetical protein M0Q43_09420 [Methanothrix sp.]|jgi:hypothetical protein|nr:hypothetical protein [Methanothrix sp.]
MENGFLIITEKDWANFTPERQNWIIYETLKSMHNRMKTLENRPLWDKCCSFIGGVIGGIAAALGVKVAI